MSARKAKELRKFAREVAELHESGTTGRAFAVPIVAGLGQRLGVGPQEFYRVVRQQLRVIKEAKP